MFEVFGYGRRRTRARYLLGRHPNALRDITRPWSGHSVRRRKTVRWCERAGGDPTLVLRSMRLGSSSVRNLSARRFVASPMGCQAAARTCHARQCRPGSVSHTIFDDSSTDVQFKSGDMATSEQIWSTFQQTHSRAVRRWSVAIAGPQDHRPAGTGPQPGSPRLSEPSRAGEIVRELWVPEWAVTGRSWLGPQSLRFSFGSEVLETSVVDTGANVREHLPDKVRAACACACSRSGRQRTADQTAAYKQHVGSRVGT